MQQINIFLTFDYELPLGNQNIKPNETLIHPTEKLLQLCDELQVSVTFFVDVMCCLQLQNWGESEFESLIRQQLQSAGEKGHDLQLHLHPHWLTSGYENKIYTPSKDFRLADFSENEIKEMVENGILYLTEIALPVKADYRCLAFRGGGYNTENPALLFDILAKNNIKIDSSMCHDFYFASDRSVVDYRRLPEYPGWFFQNGDFRNPTTDGIFEVPIAGKKKSLTELPTFIKLKVYKNRRPRNLGKMVHSENKLSVSEKRKKALSSRMLSFDNYTYSTKFLLKILQYNIKKFSTFEEINLAVASHPKSMDNYNFLLMKEFVESVRKLYGEQVCFTTFQPFAEKKFSHAISGY